MKWRKQRGEAELVAREAVRVAHLAKECIGSKCPAAPLHTLTPTTLGAGNIAAWRCTECKAIVWLSNQDSIVNSLITTGAP